MIKVRQVKIEVLSDSYEAQVKALCHKLRINENEIIKFTINKQSLDARDKNNILYVYEFNVWLKDEESFLKRKLSNDIVEAKEEQYFFNKSGKEKTNNIIIVGSGPAGLFAAYILAENGYSPLVIERGKKIEERLLDVNKFWQEGVLNPNSNVQFGEGGAGTFSDGKLNTLVKDTSCRMRKVFETFVKLGAPNDILYSYKPHIGTDKLREVIINMRNKIIEMGGEFQYETCLTDIILNDNKVTSIIVNDNKEIKCDALILAIGHSARDTFKLLYDKKVEMTSKPFAVGLRVQHPQKAINLSQYGEKYVDALGAASYKLTHKSSNERGVYTFCMCPGGFVVNASSEDGHLAINGMSNHARDEENANSAVIVTIDEKDFGTHPLDGIKYQRELERKAYEISQGKIPVQLLKDYLNNQISTEYGIVHPIFKGNYDFANLNKLLPEPVNIAIKEAITSWGRKIKEFDHPDTLLAGIESRTSSPVRIIRDEEFESNIKGIYPCGEGAGYAGGITSAAIDGIKVAEAIGQRYC